MICPKCKTEAIIESSRVDVTGDKSWATQTEVFEVQELRCRNPRCECFGKVVGEQRIRIYPAEGEAKGGEGNE